MKRSAKSRSPRGGSLPLRAPRPTARSREAEAAAAGLDIPRATYRLQLHKGFGFAEAVALVPYLNRLGISHLYCSPIFAARRGSTHGYDVVDFNRLNPELGGDEGFARLVRALRAHGMGLLLDFVPNHMGVFDTGNAWWQDVLEHGEASQYARFFDIDWRSPKPELRGKLLLPLLGDHYGNELERGRLRLHFSASSGCLTLHYYDFRFPLDPASYPIVLRVVLQRMLDTGEHGGQALAALIGKFEQLPERGNLAPNLSLARQRDARALQQQLADLIACDSHCAQALALELRRFNGRRARPASFNRLHRLLDQQAWRLAYWRVAADEINYRRFFDVNALAALAMERPRVFAATHRRLLQMIQQGEVQGLRLDHVDGLADPGQYLERLSNAIGRRLGRSQRPALYTVAEKILAAHERLPEEWPLHGTTGYEYAAELTRWQLHPDGEAPLNRCYARFIGERLEFDRLLYERKKLVMNTLLPGELNMLAQQLSRLAAVDRHSRDYTVPTLRQALLEFVACLPVYRSYVRGLPLREADAMHIDWALAQARKHAGLADPGVFDYLAQVLKLVLPAKLPQRRVLVWLRRLQQFSSAVMAKGLEDTTMYVDQHLTALDEVGADPRRFSLSTAGLHRAQAERIARWPHTLLGTSTHDSKRSEDVRARLAVLSELPDEWQMRVQRWSQYNRSRIHQLGELRAPSRNDEYLFYQTLLGIWPPSATALPDGLVERLQHYLRKAVREAKSISSWLKPNEAYEAALDQFVRDVLDQRPNNLFISDFVPFAQRIARFGLLNGLAQTCLKLTQPGVPDFYQGQECWQFNLVDPDNRRPVDFTWREQSLARLSATYSEAEAGALADRLIATLESGEARMYLVWRLLQLHRHQPELFRAGSYLPLAVQGERAEHVCSFARRYGEQLLWVVVPRWWVRLHTNATDTALDAAAWGDTFVQAPEPGSYRNVLTGERVASSMQAELAGVLVAQLLRRFPLAVLAPA